MNAGAKVAGTLAVLAVVFGGAAAAGSAVDPIRATAEPHASGHEGSTATGHGTGHGAGHGDERGDETSDAPGAGLPGLAVAQSGYRLQLADSVRAPGRRAVAFTVIGPDGEPLERADYLVQHEKLMHLIVVRRDHAGFQHVHPVLDEQTGQWSVEADLTPGSWRVFADFAPADGAPLTLGSDLLVPGQTAPPRPSPVDLVDDVDGYEVSASGDLVAGEHSMVTLEISRDGAPVTDLQPYLGAYGHLVALREGDLAFLHVHPGGDPGDGETSPGPVIEFGTEIPSPGRYHLYLNFKHEGVVRTASFVVEAS